MLSKFSLGMLEGFGEAFHLAPAYAGDVRMDAWDVGGCAREVICQPILPRFWLAGRRGR